MSLLEDQWAACSPGGGGVLHMTPGILTGLFGVMPDVEGVLYSTGGSMVIVGAGYKEDPQFDAVPWDGDWMWMTGPVQVWLGEPRVYPEELDMAFNRKTNDIVYKAERLAAVTFDGCCVFAVKVAKSTDLSSFL